MSSIIRCSTIVWQFRLAVWHRPNRKSSTFSQNRPLSNRYNWCNSSFNGEINRRSRTLSDPIFPALFQTSPSQTETGITGLCHCHNDVCIVWCTVFPLFSNVCVEEKIKDFPFFVVCLTPWKKKERGARGLSFLWEYVLFVEDSDKIACSPEVGKGEKL